MVMVMFGGEVHLGSNPHHPGTSCVALGKLLSLSERQLIYKMEGC